MKLAFGNTSVPYTVSWSSEIAFRVAPCEWANGRPAICQSESLGVGKPIFGKPHSQRQRRAISCALCDLCGTPLKNSTKISLSHARVRDNGADGPCVMQVEPLLHKQCAIASMQFCPSLRKDIRAGTLRIRQVTRFRVQFALMSPEFVGTYVPGYIAGRGELVVGHAKVELIRWQERTEDWLREGVAP